MASKSENLQSLQAALLTPIGRGAVGVIRLHGKLAGEVLSRLTTPRGKQLTQSGGVGALAQDAIALVHWGDERGEEVVICRASDGFEICCHGGLVAATRILADLATAGAKIVDWRAALDSEEPDPIRREARIAIALAPTERTAAILLDQYRGALRDVIEEIGSCFSSGDSASALQSITTLLDRAKIGARLITPWRVVLAGAPNVGKSSLSNALLGFERSIVADQPGTTRDVVAARTALDGWLVEFSDTAGMRRGETAIEAAGIELANEAVAHADLVVGVIDASDPATIAAIEPILSTRSGRPMMLALNKIDLSPNGSESFLQRSSPPLASLEWIATSATTSEGIDALSKRMLALLLGMKLELKSAVPFTLRQTTLLGEAVRLLALQDISAAQRTLALL